MKHEIMDQMKYADAALYRIQIIDPKARVAGGAPRNWALDLEANDIDIFMKCPRSQQTMTDLQQTLRKLIPGDWESIEPPTINDSSEYKMNSDVEDVFELEAGQERPKIQVIRLSTSTTCLFENFPLSISKIWYHNGEIHTTKDFDISVKHKVIYKTMEEYSDTHPYIKKVRDAFSDYRYFSSKIEFLETLV